MKLEIKHIVPYLLFDLKFSVHLVSEEYWIEILRGINRNTLLIGGDRIDVLTFTLPDLRIKPILRPMSDFFKLKFEEEMYEIERVCESDFMLDNINLLRIMVEKNLMCDVYNLPYNIVDFLFENMFDVFGLIEKGLAISTNDFDVAVY